MASERKKTKGRQKIEIKMIGNEVDRLITFSKRRSGINKKISELFILCGTKILFIVFSPAGNPFSFCFPSIESVANQFLNENVLVNGNTNTPIEANHMVRLNKLIQHYNEVHNQVEASKEKRKVLVMAQGTSGTVNTNHWWETPIDKHNSRELHELYSRFSELINLFHTARSKKIAINFPMLAPTYSGYNHSRGQF
ncbi:hypothetical protein GOBAR_DD32041 [Gossypium barbadense]|nr:hypothetical protein GOBAR_DD32041 [Gossypium barbadense]